MEEVASSRISTGGLATAARAMASSCRCPWERLAPVSYTHLFLEGGLLAGQVRGAGLLQLAPLKQFLLKLHRHLFTPAVHLGEAEGHPLHRKGDVEGAALPLLQGGQGDEVLAVVPPAGDAQPPEAVSYTHLEVYKRQA